MSKPKNSPITKNADDLHFFALLILAVVSYVSIGITSLIAAAIAVLVAVGIDFLLYKVAVGSPLNTMSAVLIDLIVALSYTLKGLFSTLKTTRNLWNVLKLKNPKKRKKK